MSDSADPLVHALAGAAGGALALSVTYPLSTITMKLQNNEDGKERDELTAKRVILDILSKDGVLGLYSGLESALYGMTVTNFIYYYFYEKTGKYFKMLNKVSQLSTTNTMMTGAIAGVITAVATNPVWVANTRITLKKSDVSTLRTIKNIVAKEGAQNLFNGLKPALILVINPIIQYTIFEQLKIIVLNSQVGKKRNLSANWAFILGAIGKIAATSITYPYITLKTRMHMSTSSSAKGESSSSLVLEILKKEGIAGLFNGFFYKLSQSVLTVALLFYFKEGLLSSTLKLLKIIRSRRIKT
ncbi:hypothetical protein Kpol_440p6 [Vanderwaltozyma polyspora DSM 70294]|uniref:Peroxisomal membrane protein PMP47B n=1 Tax=Vanderwaltozyma polyspora (strain ATCC 22028 / DSM 70294 / BCRC 21397 / CBS 2163 / NBRC 10782 / NRRL Y-8283 / UCD 57-17) TaxID=436907 RepID=A7TRE5_VANPO|nr:uncharacterized protein Kpol_440p6 [Vanderwaltozyma polyspora DSM 70294]EDO15159.1 hypothetical protein Kpol_440p6 [Vanderwaltozyma polyspora DSM 70294]